MILFLLTAFASPRDDLVRPDALPAWAGEDGEARVEGAWWDTFGDPGLSQIMTAAVSANRDLRASVARAHATNAASKQTFASVSPQISFDVSGTLAPTATRGFQFGGFQVPGAPEPPKTYQTGSAAFTAAWEPDVFLKNTENIRASRHDARAAEGDRDAVILAFATRVAEGYFDLVTARQRVEIVERQQQATEALLEIVELRYQGGDATAVDLLQQRQQAATVRAQVPLARAQVTTLEQQLAVALALPPATVVPGVSERLPALPPVPDAGIPADLVLSRPDLRAAEYRLDAATARKNTAVRQLLPTLRIQGQAGWQFFNETELKSQTFWTASASVSVPLFQGGRTHYGIESARAAEVANVHAYTQLAANAVLEVESALVLERQRAAHLEATSAQEEAARQAWEEARTQYVAGIGNYLALLTSQTTHQAAELAKLDSQRQLISARIQLHDALGGSWPADVAESIGDAR
ncbi:MAG: TolC family protein [Alphaproteobacteria bacterium]|nr:TolC family protein [Alphaproteobacteria bacterium]